MQSHWASVSTIMEGPSAELGNQGIDSLEDTADVQNVPFSLKRAGKPGSGLAIKDQQNLERRLDERLVAAERKKQRRLR